jgi:hypothetical protein
MGLTPGGRQKPSSKVGGIAKAADMTYNEDAGATKVLGPILGKLLIIGPASPQVAIDPGSTVAFFNSNTVVHYVKIGTGTLSAPSSPANGIPLPVGVYTVLAMGKDNAFLSDSALVFAYQVVDDTNWNPNTTTT